MMGRVAGMTKGVGSDAFPREPPWRQPVVTRWSTRQAERLAARPGTSVRQEPVVRHRSAVAGLAHLFRRDPDVICQLGQSLSPGGLATSRPAGIR
jgi:hypothetical protein